MNHKKQHTANPLEAEQYGQHRPTIRLAMLLGAAVIIALVAAYVAVLSGATFGLGILLLEFPVVWRIVKLVIKQRNGGSFKKPQPEAVYGDSQPSGPPAGNSQTGMSTGTGQRSAQKPSFIPTSAEMEDISEAFNQLSPAQFNGIAIHKKINILSANPALATLFGYNPGELAGMTILDLLTPESHSIVLRNTLAKFDYPYQALGRKKDGSTLPIEILCKIITCRGQDVSVMGIREIVEREPAEVAESLQQTREELEAQVKHNTTELRYANERLQLELGARRQAERALRESEERYRQLVEFSPDGIIIHTGGKISYINAAGVKMLGATKPEELIGKPIMDFVPPKFRHTIEERIQQILQNKEQAPPIEQKYIRLDNTEIDVEVVGIPFTQNNEPAIQLVVRDITERKKVEREISKRNRELTILQSAGAAITSRLDVRYVLDTVAQEMAKLLGIENCAIFDWSLTENTITKIAAYSPTGWWDPKTQEELHNLENLPLTRSVLEEQIPEQMTIGQAYIDPFELADMQQHNVKTRLLLPMLFQKRVLGLVKLDDTRAERIFTYQEISLAKLLAGQAASAIENARLYGQLRQRVTELTMLNEISQAISSTLDLQEMLKIINEHMIQLLNVAATSVVLCNEADNSLWFAAAAGEGADFVLGKKLSVGEGIVGWVVEHGEPLLIPDVSEDERFYNFFDQESGFLTRSVLCVPLQTKGQTIGAIEAMNKEGGVFEQADLRLLNSVAAPAATAIENARLFEQAQEEIKERQRAEAALENERALLAQRVEERTAELSRANAELARASRLKDEFLASMSHELRTPLNAILGSAEILQSEVFGQLEEKQVKYVNHVDESGRHLLALINDILDLSKIEAGKMELDLRPVSIQSICEASVRLVKQMAHKKKIHLSHQLKNTVPSLQADERRLKQILVNLLSNAVKFTPEGGQVGLEVSEDLARHAIQFTVWDTGIGIAPDDLSRLFQPFVQVDSTLSRQHAGTGLGLSLVSRMVEMHGGGISVDSRVDKGSRFTVSLPQAGPTEMSETGQQAGQAAAAPSPDTPTRQPQKGEAPSILLAEDNEASITLFTDYLKTRGYRVVVARNGHEVIDRVKEDEPDLILMDIHMPEMDGLEATRRLRANASQPAIPIIVMTALAMPGDRERCLKAGANAYLSKPVSLNEMVQTIENFMSPNS